MAANGIQFTEQQLNAMYRQQMLTQQAYRQWVAALPPEQQMLLQSRMQASMQQVQHQMAQIMTQAVRVEVQQVICCESVILRAFNRDHFLFKTGELLAFFALLV